MVTTAVASGGELCGEFADEKSVVHNGRSSTGKGGMRKDEIQEGRTVKRERNCNCNCSIPGGMKLGYGYPNVILDSIYLSRGGKSKGIRDRRDFDK